MFAFNDAFRRDVADRCAAFPSPCRKRCCGQPETICRRHHPPRNPGRLGDRRLPADASGQGPARAQRPMGAARAVVATRPRRWWRRCCESSMRRSACGSARAPFSGFSTTIRPAPAIASRPWCCGRATIRSFAPTRARSHRCIALRCPKSCKPDAVDFVAIPESDKKVIRIRVDGSLIHAPTGAMIYQFRELLAGRTTRVADLDQPVFAWR
jgi:hypothetical protein